MSFFADLSERLRALLFPGRQEQEMDEEMRFHMEHEAETRRRQGASAGVAEREATLAFGSVERFKEEVRDARGVRLLQDAVADVRYAFRAMRNNPGFTAAVVLVLGLGIGATTAAFTVVDDVLISELPFPHAERLVRVFPNQPRGFPNLSTVDYQAIRDQQKSFDAFGGMNARVSALAGTGDPRRILGGRVSAGFFQVLSVRPAFGRLVEERDEVVGAPAVVVLAHELAGQLFGEAQGAIGRAVTLDDVSHEVVGVLPPGRAGLAGLRASVWTALQTPTPTRRGPFWIRGIARLKEGVTIEDARRDLASISERIFPIWAAGFQDKDARFTPVSLREAIVGAANNRIVLFAAAVALVLLVAIANVATLVLVRASGRSQELAVRVALGASRSRLSRLLLVEGMTFTAFAGIAGIAFASLGVQLVASLAPGLPRIAEVALDGRSLVFATIATVLAGFLVSLSPLSTVVSRQASQSLRADSRRAGTSRRTNLLRAGFVVAEFALALPLLMGAGLMLNSFVRLQRVDPGFDATGLVSMSVALPGARYTDTTAVLFWRRAEALVAEVPGLSAAGLTTELPPTDPGNVNNFDLVDHPVPAGTSQPASPWVFVTNGYFAAMGIQLLDGRLFTAGDSGNAPPVVVVSKSWAERYFPREHAVGRQLIEGGCVSCPRTTIVGIVSDVKYSGLREGGEAVYNPFEQGGGRNASIVARSRSDEAAATRALREITRGLDPELPVTEATLGSLLDGALADPRNWTAVIGSFAAVSVLLAALGAFGLMSYVVRQRRREIGVRIALGARPQAVTWMIVLRGMRLSTLGAALGLILAFVEARWLEAQLFGVGAMDPMTLVAVAVALLGAAFFASWVPGRNAARISPVEAIAGD